MTSKGNDIVLMDSDSEDAGEEIQARKRQKLTASHKLDYFQKPYMSSSSSEPSDDSSAENGVLPEVELEGSLDSELIENNESDTSSSDDGLDRISLSDLTDVSPRLILETRKYLKDFGTMMFLDKYLPTTASSEDIMRLIVQLGYIPRDLDESSSGSLLDLINYLHQAMKNIGSIRSKLPLVYNIDHAVELIRNSKKILVITGAGISTSLGIPDFRSSKGFYSQVQHLGLSDPQEVFDLEIFHSDPSLFYSIAQLILPPDKVFSPLHAFIKLLQVKGKLLRNYTQNIDDLEGHVGIKPERVIQCHGSFAGATCVTCKYQVKGEKIFPQIRSQSIPYCPKCSKTRQKISNKGDVYIPESYGVMKPDITFFGEPLPKRFHDTIVGDLHECDLVICIGTSLKVAPVADIVEKVPESVPQILINKDPIGHCNFDVSLLGYCDEVVSYLCNKLGEGWSIPHEDYKRLVEKTSKLKVKVLSEEDRLYKIGGDEIENNNNDDGINIDKI